MFFVLGSYKVHIYSRSVPITVGNRPTGGQEEALNVWKPSEQTGLA